MVVNIVSKTFQLFGGKFKSKTKSQDNSSSRQRLATESSSSSENDDSLIGKEIMDNASVCSRTTTCTISSSSSLSSSALLLSSSVSSATSSSNEKKTVVRFDLDNLTYHHHPHFSRESTTCSDEDKEKDIDDSDLTSLTWYTNDEYEEIKKSAYQIIINYGKGIMIDEENDNENSIRGLEIHLIPETAGVKERIDSIQRKAIIKLYKNLQREKQIYNLSTKTCCSSDLIRTFAINSSNSDITNAMERATQDEQYVLSLSKST